jgi:DNA gyrase/topoisomerase IV subunit B
VLVSLVLRFGDATHHYLKAFPATFSMCICPTASVLDNNLTLCTQAGKIKEAGIPGEFIREGLTAVVSVKVPEPEFEGQTKTRLGNPEVRQIVDGVVGDALQMLFEWHPALGLAVCGKALAAQAAAVAARAAREMVGSCW